MERQPASSSLSHGLDSAFAIGGQKLMQGYINDLFAPARRQ